MKSGRNSVGIEIDPEYCKMTEERLREENSNMFSAATLEFIYPAVEVLQKLAVSDNRDRYLVRKKKLVKQRA
jgi:site-specific DNA-methyltransferase (adenine-specific)